MHVLLQWTISAMTSRNKNGGDSMGTLYREPMGKLMLRYKKSKNLLGEAYIQSSNTNSPGITKTSQKIERLSKTRGLALDDCIFMPHLKYFWIS